ELVRVGVGDGARVERAESPADLERAGERDLHGHLLVEQHAEQEREGVVLEEAVRVAVAREPESHGAMVPAVPSVVSRARPRASSGGCQSVSGTPVARPGTGARAGENVRTGRPVSGCGSTWHRTP